MNSTSTANGRQGAARIIRDLIVLARPTHWIKNGFLLAAPLFGGALTSTTGIARTATAIAAFCLLASSVYILNDIIDREQDRLHPRKRNRPVASGRISLGLASVLGLALFVPGGLAAAYLGPYFVLFAAAYVILNVAYSLVLKHRVIVDVICLALGFVLRALAGAVAVHVSASIWLVICTFSLCLFLGFAKRRCEVYGMGSTAAEHRPVNAAYNLVLLDHLLAVTSGLAILTFLLYTAAPETEAKFGSRALFLSSPLVMYGIFRFYAKVEEGSAESPVDLILRDSPMQLTILLWTAYAAYVVYFKPHLPFLE